MAEISVLHTGNFDEKAGGPAMSTYYTLKGLIKEGEKAELVMYEIRKGHRLVGEDVPIHYVRRPLIGGKLLYSSLLKKAMRCCGDYDIYHAQGIWQYPTYAVVDVAREKNKPYIITPRGMLYPQDIAKSNKFLKGLSLRYRLLNDLNKAACVHVTCKEEMLHCRNIGITSPIAVIPNSIEIKQYFRREKNEVFRLGYLGRISPRKNIQSLFYAWSSLGDKVKDAELVIMGSGNKSYENFLRKEVERLKLNNVIFTGFLADELKDKVLSTISVLILPSEFENFGNVILEGLERGIPCIATKGAPWKEIETYQCGWWIDFSQSSITSAINKALNTSVDDLEQMGRNGIRLIKENYSYELVGKKMNRLYEWILDKRTKPDFVYLFEEVSNKIRIVHFIPSIDRTSGGTTTYMELLARELGKLVDLHIVTYRTDHPVQINNCMIHPISRFWRYFEMRSQWKTLLKKIKPAVVHINCCWMPSCAYTQKWAQDLGYKVVLSPHGMLEPWILKRHHWSKKIPAMWLYQKRAIVKADYIHSTAESEKSNILKLKLNNKIEIVPNGIDLNIIPMKRDWHKTKQLLFLSRIHPKKGIESLIKAVSILEKEMADYHIIIAGEGEVSYLNQLKENVSLLGLEPIFDFVGGVYDDDKWELYQTSDLFVLPTFSENFGIVIAEALASGTPVITTKGTPWKDLETYHCGKWIEIGTAAMTDALRECIGLSSEELEVMGKNGRKLIEDKYSSKMMADKMVHLYESIIEDSKR